MSTPKTNQFLKQLISEISNKATEGRMGVTWNLLEESKKKKLVKEAPMNKPEEKEEPEAEDPTQPQKPVSQTPAVPENPTAPNVPEAPAEPEASTTTPEPGTEASAEEQGDANNPEQAQADTVKANAELEKAKAEKDQAEKEIKKQSYVHLVSTAGVYFLLGKLVSHAFKTNTIDALASEMDQKLKIQNDKDYQNFAEEMAPFRSIPGVGDLLSSMKTMVANKSENPEAETGAESPQ